VRRLLVTADVVPSSPIFVTLMMETLSSSGASVHTRATWHNIPQDAILHSHCNEILKSYIDHRNVPTCQVAKCLAVTWSVSARGMCNNCTSNTLTYSRALGSLLAHLENVSKATRFHRYLNQNIDSLNRQRSQTLNLISEPIRNPTWRRYMPRNPAVPCNS
jgi:hypothetical protein